MRCQWGTG